MPQETNTKNPNTLEKNLERIALHTQWIASQLQELNHRMIDIDITLRETHQVLERLKAKKFWLFWK